MGRFKAVSICAIGVIHLFLFQNCSNAEFGVATKSSEASRTAGEGDDHSGEKNPTTPKVASKTIMEVSHYGWYGMNTDGAVCRSTVLLSSDGRISVQETQFSGGNCVSEQPVTEIAVLSDDVVGGFQRVITSFDTTGLTKQVFDNPISCDGGSFDHAIYLSNGTRYVFAGRADCQGDYMMLPGSLMTPVPNGTVSTYQLQQISNILLELAQAYRRSLPNQI